MNNESEEISRLKKEVCATQAREFGAARNNSKPTAEDKGP
jgi:hypothetical protein